MVFRAQKRFMIREKKLRAFPDSNSKVVAPMVCAQKRVKIKYRKGGRGGGSCVYQVHHGNQSFYMLFIAAQSARR